MKTDFKIIKRVETQYFVGTLRSDGIVHFHIKGNTMITIDVQKEMERNYNLLTSIPRPFIFTGDEFISITSEARENAVAMEDRVPISVSAIVVNNLAQRIIADYYYKFNRPKNPYKVFTKETNAINWIKKNHYIPPV